MLSLSYGNFPIHTLLYGGMNSINWLLFFLIAPELGISACRYSGGYDTKNEACHADPVKINKLPEHCTAFIYDGITCIDKGHILYPTYINEDTCNYSILY